MVVFGKHVHQSVLSCAVLISREWKCSWGLLKASDALCSGLRKAACAVLHGVFFIHLKHTPGKVNIALPPGITDSAHE